MGKGYTYSDGTVPSICIIGAGFSGLTAGIQLKKQLKLNSFTIFDENHDIGGTWLVNNYPGAACDIPSHLYSWSFELNPDWPEAYSSSSEILNYMKRVVRKYELYNNIKLNSMVNSIVWNESTLKWNVKTFNKVTKKEEKYVFDLVLNGTGILRKPNYPKEFQAFNGVVVHSAEWDSTIDLENKVVGVVGNGSSAIQIIPAIASKVKELHCYQRKPAHVNLRPQKKFSYFTKSLFKIFPPIMWLYRLCIFLFFELFRRVFDDNSLGQKFGTDYTLKFLKEKIPNNESLRNKLTPKFKYGCKRVLFHNDYYSSFNLEHVKLHTDKILKIDGNKILCGDGSNPKIDVLILATGFSFRDYFDPLRIIGKDSMDLVKSWKENVPSSYLGIISNDTPNHFIILGPNTALGHNTVVFMIECQVNYIMQVIKQIIERNAKCVQPKKEVEDEYMKEVYSSLQSTVWATGNCGSWYRRTQKEKLLHYGLIHAPIIGRATKYLNPNDLEFF